MYVSPLFGLQILTLVPVMARGLIGNTLCTVHLEEIHVYK